MENTLSREKIIVIDFGGQYNQLVARRVRECNVYCEIYSYRTDLEQIRAMRPMGIILTGGPNGCSGAGTLLWRTAYDTCAGRTRGEGSCAGIRKNLCDGQHRISSF